MRLQDVRGVRPSSNADHLKSLQDHGAILSATAADVPCQRRLMPRSLSTHQIRAGLGARRTPVSSAGVGTAARGAGLRRVRPTVDFAPVRQTAHVCGLAPGKPWGRGLERARSPSRPTPGAPGLVATNASSDHPTLGSTPRWASQPTVLRALRGDRRRTGEQPPRPSHGGDHDHVHHVQA
jgi:hypothetical protein